MDLVPINFRNPRIYSGIEYRGKLNKDDTKKYATMFIYLVTLIPKISTTLESRMAEALDNILICCRKKTGAGAVSLDNIVPLI